MGSRLAYIELLRFILALSVVIYHYFYFGPATGLISAEPVTTFLPFLLLAVEVFFIVSGFVIMFSAAGRSNVDFAIARFARLGPTLLVCSTITYIVLLIAPLAGLNTPSIHQWLISVLVVPLMVFHGVDWSLWSLKYEIIFYVLIFWLISLGVTTGRLKVLACVLLFSDLIQAIVSIFAGHISHNYGAFFVIGMLFYLRASGEERLVLLWAAAVALSLVDCWLELQRVEVGMLGHHGPNPLECLIAGVIVIGTFMIFHGGTKSRAFAKICALAGSASFPLYVIHQLLGYRLIAWANELLSVDMMTIRLFTIGLMVLFSVAFSFAIEKPLMSAYKAFGGRIVQLASLTAYRLR
jgi:peptidoglycan/LPS O-acetylase OafA/YrhL